MEIMALALVVGIIIAIYERGERKRIFPPGKCSGCEEQIRHNGKIWVHTKTRQQMASSEGGPPGTLRRHPALPPLRAWELGGDEG
jgi:hypothetical protein